ncbi:hypothetical protein GCM10010393_16230 [Streptomyces gobitricini]|uniref:Insertion element IS402-like domain-containing protein n=1 Tax=Streptomyces gobitricini TaxID=68211 RepID=A0ABN3LKM7_9ACTN
MLDRTPKRDGRWRDHRQVIDAIAFNYRTGTPWVDMPERFESWKGAHNRLRKWATDGTWEKVSTALLSPRATPKATSTGSSRSTPPSSEPTSTPPGPVKRAPAVEPNDHALGRSRGGLTTKIHLASDSNYRPLAFVRPGQACDAPAFLEVMARSRVPSADRLSQAPKGSLAP